MSALILKLLHQLPPETAHHSAIKLLRYFPVKNIIADIDLSELSQTYRGLKFLHPIGLAAGFDKDAEVFDKLGQLGFSFVEAGTVTPLAQPGNPKPRLFRIREKEAIINSYGFNSKGMQYALDNINKYAAYSVLGINLGINKNTLNPIDDFLRGAENFIDNQKINYFTINISSPNTPGLRDLQNPVVLRPIIDNIKAMIKQKNSHIPLLVKLSPDIPIEQERSLIEFLAESTIDGIIISNTTTRREGLERSYWESIKGGLSGTPLRSYSTEMIKRVYHITRGNIPIIGCGGISSGADAFEKLCAGANLLQIYTSFIYHGPLILRKILLELKSLFTEKNINNMGNIIGNPSFL